MTASRWMFVVRGSGNPGQFAAMMGRMGSFMLAQTLARVALVVTDRTPPLAVFPFRQGPVAVWSLDALEVDPADVCAALAPLGAVSAYEVETAYPVAYAQDWPDGQPTPAPILLTLLRRRQGLPDDIYLKRWHEGHTTLSLEVHPLWHYDRNVILRPLDPQSDPCDGIVVEACRNRAALLDPRRFYGGTLRMVPNMVRITVDLLGFLDLARTEVYFATETVLRSNGSAS